MYYKIINKKKTLITRTADLIGYALCAPLNLFKPKMPAPPFAGVREILVVRTAYIGDVIMTLPVLKPLKELYPGARITFLTGKKAAEAIDNNPHIDEVIAYDAFWFYPRKMGRALKEYIGFLGRLRARRYDLVIDARGDIRDISLVLFPAKSRYRVSYNVGGGGFLLTHVVPYGGLSHKVEYHLDIARYLGCKTGETEWGICLREDEKDRVADIMRAQGIKGPFISAHPGSRLSLKRWPPERCAALYDLLIEEYGMPLVLFGAVEDRPIVDDIMHRMRHRPVNLAGKLSIRELAGMLERSSLFICNDSAPMHIAAAMKTPTVAIFGPSKSVETGPYGNVHRVVEKDFPCRYECDEGSCGYGRHNACMTDIGVIDVMRAAREVLPGVLSK